MQNVHWGIAHHLQTADLLHNELDSVILGSLISVVNMGDNIKDGIHKCLKRNCTFTLQRV